MSKTFTLINTVTDTFAQWLTLTNGMAAAYANVVTTKMDSTGDYTNLGNGFVIGIFGANTVVAFDSLRGGNVATAANLNIISNVYATGANSTFTSNLFVVSANAAFNVNTFSLNGTGAIGNAITISTNSTHTNSVMRANNFSLQGNSTIINAAAFSNSVSITGVLNTANVQTFVTATNAILATSGANSSTWSSTGEKLIDSFDGSAYRGGKYLISIKDSGGSAYQMTELLVMHDGSSTYTTEYATLRSGSNLGVFTANVNGSTVRLYSNSQVSSSVYTINRTLLAV